MLTDLTIIQDETRWGPNAYEQMIEEAKARARRKDEAARELQEKIDKKERKEKSVDYWRTMTEIKLRREKDLAIKNEREAAMKYLESPTKIKNPRESAQAIVTKISEMLLIPTKNVFAFKRTGDLVICRQICIYQVKKRTNWSLPRIGRFFNGRDHSTVIHSIRRINRLCREDEAFAARIAEIDAAIDEMLAA